MYHAASRISPHFGEAEPLHHFRINEKILANFCHSMALITQIMQAPCADEWKTFKTVEFMSYLGLQTHYPYFAVCLVIANRQIYNQNPTILSQQPMVIYSQWQKILFDQMKNAYCTFTAYSLRLMLLRMSLLPLTWHPHAGPTCLIQALKTHLYAFVMGAFGKSTFRYLSQVDYHPKLGPIFGGPLLDFTPSSSSFFCNHAILLIGLRDRGSGHGEVYFIDPQDASGPGLLQTVYKMSMKDFFNRLRDSYGAHPSQPKTGEFVWVGHPALFLP
jgi:hypothetical protein